jgi:carbonic anhydrase
MKTEQNMKTLTQEIQTTITPKQAIQMLKDGNARFMANQEVERDLLAQVAQTSTGQYPFATILHCIDSRVSAELIFDQGIGDIFSVRIAGNFVNDDILGSMEFACKLAGTKAIVVLGHTSCGAVKGACDDAKLGNLTTLLSKLKPAVEAVTTPKDPNLRNSRNIDFVNSVAEKNVYLTIENIRQRSQVLNDMEDFGDIAIVGAMYDIKDGSVTFYE